MNEKKVKISLRNLKDNIKQTNTGIMGSQKEERKKNAESWFEKIMAENFPNLEKEIDIHVQEVQRVPNEMKTKEPNLYSYIMRNAGLDEAQAGIKIAEWNINNHRYADDTALMEESEEELKSLLMKVKQQSEKVRLKLKNI